MNRSGSRAVLGGRGRTRPQALIPFGPIRNNGEVRAAPTAGGPDPMLSVEWSSPAVHVPQLIIPLA